MLIVSKLIERIFTPALVSMTVLLPLPALAAESVETNIQIGSTVQSTLSPIKLPGATITSKDGAWSPKLEGTRGNDVFDAGKFGGTATLRGNGGNDVFYGGGKFIVSGGVNTWISRNPWGSIQLPDGFKNLIFKGPGTYIYLKGNSQNNVIVALSPVSNIDGGKGNDTLVGYAQDSTTFIVNSGEGNDAIIKFKTGNTPTADKIQLRKGTFADYAAIKRSLAQVGTNTVLTLETGEKLTLVGVNMNTLNAVNFMMRAPEVEPKAGVCGNANNRAVSRAPTEFLCEIGTPSLITGTGPWSWTCKGIDGGPDSPTCSAPTLLVPVNGTCGSANGQTVATAPTGNLCATGTSTAIAGSGPWTWTCLGKDGGVNSAICSAPKTPDPVNGTCGTASGIAVSSAPSTNLCATGTPSAISGSGPWTWTCAGAYGGTNSAACSAPKSPAPVNGTCGTAAGVSVSSAPTAGLCGTGTASKLTGTGPWSWVCQGANGGTNSPMCSAPITAGVVNGSCGGANGLTMSAAPVGGFCFTGTPTALSGTGPWTWTCKGANGGIDSSVCSVIKATGTQNGVCGYASGKSVASAPSGTVLCTTGTASAVAGSGPWTWTCKGILGGTDSGLCSSSKLNAQVVAGKCGVANNMTNLTTIPEGKTDCVLGSVEYPLNPYASSWTWTCLGQNGAANATCSAALTTSKMDAVCGPSAGTTVAMPTSGLCAVGIPTPITTTAMEWTWTCTGLNGGASVQCVDKNASALPGECGYINGASVPSAPKSDLCQTGKTSGAAGTGPWTWTCAGTNGAPNASCSAGVNTSCAGTMIKPRSTSIMTSPTVPQASLAGDIVGVNLQNISKDSSLRYHTFGQAFRQGDVKKTDSIIGRLNGKNVPIQVDALSTWPDGSIKMAALTVQAALCPGSELPMMIAKGVPDADVAVGVTPVNMLTVPINLSAMLEYSSITTGAKTSHTIDIGTALKAALANPLTADYWLRGPLVSQARVDIPMPEETFHVTADVSVYRDGDIIADVQFNNDKGKVVQNTTELKLGSKPPLAPMYYNVTVNLNGLTKTHLNIKQFQYQNWRTTLRTKGDIFMNVQKDIKYLIGFGALLPYDLSSGVTYGGFEARITKLLYSSAFGKPFAANGISPSMGTTGARPDIGYTTQWNTFWIMTQDWQAAKVGMAQGDTAGVVPWNFKDEYNRLITTELPIKEFTYKVGSKVTVVNTAKEIWAGDSRCGLTCLQNVPANTIGSSGWGFEDAHQPNLGYVPYLFTAQRWYLDRLNAQAAKSVTTQPYRNPSDDPNSNNTILMGAQRQIRGIAWSFREVLLAAFIGKTGTTEHTYFNQVVNDNFDYVLSQRPLYELHQGQTYGWWRDLNIGETVPTTWRQNIAPWQQDFMTAVIAWGAFMGNDKAKQIIDWQRNWLGGRFDPTIAGYDPNDGCAYSLNTYSRTTGEPFKTWPEISASMIAEGKARGALGCEGGYYGRLGRASLGMALRLFPNDERLKRGLNWLMHSKASGISLATRQKEPTYNVEANYE